MIRTTGADPHAASATAARAGVSRVHRPVPVAFTKALKTPNTSKAAEPPTPAGPPDK